MLKITVKKCKDIIRILHSKLANVTCLRSRNVRRFFAFSIMKIQDGHHKNHETMQIISSFCQVQFSVSKIAFYGTYLI